MTKSEEESEKSGQSDCKKGDYCFPVVQEERRNRIERVCKKYKLGTTLPDAEELGPFYQVDRDGRFLFCNNYKVNYSEKILYAILIDLYNGLGILGSRVGLTENNFQNNGQLKQTCHLCSTFTTHRICRTWFRHTFSENLSERT